MKALANKYLNNYCTGQIKFVGKKHDTDGLFYVLGYRNKKSRGIWKLCKVVSTVAKRFYEVDDRSIQR